MRLDAHALAVERADVPQHPTGVADQLRVPEHLGGEQLDPLGVADDQHVRAKRAGLGEDDFGH